MNSFVQSLKSHQHIVSLEGALSWPEKSKHRQIQESWGGREGPPGTERARERGWGWASGLETHRCPGALPCPVCPLRPDPLPPAGGWTHCSLPWGRLWGMSPSHRGIHGWMGNPQGTAASVLNQWIKGGRQVPSSLRCDLLPGAHRPIAAPPVLGGTAPAMTCPKIL